MIGSLVDCFNGRDQKNGEDLFNKGAVNVGSFSDTQVSAYISASGSPRVSMVAESISSPIFQTNCTCTTGKKGRLCKHVWATLLKLESLGADFLACRSTVEAGEAKPESEAIIAAKKRQAEYQRQMKEKVKLRNKERRQKKKRLEQKDSPAYPPEVEAAIAYFSEYGIDLSESLDLKTLASARKTLARVFHPDKGGTHEEVLALNNNHDVIATYLS